MLDKRGKQSVFIQHEVKLKQKRNKKSSFKVPDMPLKKLLVMDEVNDGGSVTSRNDYGNYS